MDLVLRGGTVVTAASVGQADVGIEQGKIVALGSGIPQGSEEIDVTGSYVFPGGVDVHTHLHRSRGAPQRATGEPRIPADDLRLGSRAAAAGGVTTLVDFAWQGEGASLQQTVDDAIEDTGSQSYIDYSFHVIIGDPSPTVIAEVPQVVEQGFPTFKYFLPRLAAGRGSDYLRFHEQVGSAGGMVMVHCEDPSLLSYHQEALLSQGKTALRYYPESRPRDVEALGTETAVRMCAATGTPTYIVHLSCEAALKATRAGRASGLPVYVEIRPIYLYLTEELFDQEDREAAKYVGIPPLRDQHDVDAMWTALRGGDIDVVATDHMSYRMEDKYRDGDAFDAVFPGMSNLETLLPMLFSEGVGTGRLSLERFVDVIATTPAKLFGLYPQKGTIAVGSDADICVLDPEKRFTVRAAEMQSASDFEAFEGFEIKGWPTLTISRGEVIFRDGELTAEDGRGALVSRQLNRLQ